MPTPFNLYGSPEFVFKCPMNFTDRFDPGDKKYFSGESIKLEDRLSQANFIPSVTKMALDLWAYRGPGTNMDVLMAGGRFICHVSEFPKGSYKKAHGSFGGRHRPPRTGLVSENSYLFLSGEGYDLQWAPGVLPGLGVEWKRADFKRGSLMTNGHGIHQHFNTSDEAARYLVLRCADFPFGGGSKANEAARGVRGQEMGDRIQIEFENEDPRIRPMFEEECRRRSVRCAMPAT
jgi:hypothetical protein